MKAARLSAEGPSQAELSLVRRNSRRGLIRRSGSRRIAPAIIVGVISVVVLVVGVLLEQVVLAQSAFKLSGIRQELAQAEELQEELRLEAARLESPARIEAYARDRLGMVEPLEVDYIVVDVRTASRSKLAGLPTTKEVARTGPASAAGVTP